MVKILIRQLILSYQAAPSTIVVLLVSSTYNRNVFYSAERTEIEWYLIAFMRDDIILAKITTKPRFENANFRFYHEPKWWKEYPRENITKKNEGLRNDLANEAWWWIERQIAQTIPYFRRQWLNWMFSFLPASQKFFTSQSEVYPNQMWSARLRFPRFASATRINDCDWLEWTQRFWFYDTEFKTLSSGTIIS